MYPSIKLLNTKLLSTALGLMAAIFILGTQTSFAQENSQKSILDLYPALKNEHFKEPKNSLYFGLGVSPVQVMTGRLGYSLSFFQLHTIKHRLDWEIFNAAFGATSARGGAANSTFFQFRTAPKFRVFKSLSIGPMGGMEFISFQGVESRLTRERFFAPYEPFSVSGLTYGLVLTQTIPLKNDVLLRISQLAYRQQYEVVAAGDGWTHQFKQAQYRTEAGRENLQPSQVLAFEISILF